MLKNTKIGVLALFPGMGHFYIGKRWRGAAVLLGYLFCLWVFMFPDRYAQPPPAEIFFVIWLILTLLFWAYSIFDLRKEMGTAPTRQTRKT